MTGRRNRDTGSATVWVISVVLALGLVLAAVTVRTLAVLARHRAESAADLAALAAAGRIGTSGDPCAAASRWAELNGASVVACTVELGADGRSGSVRVSLKTSVRLPIVGASDVTASARAGRSADGSTGPAPRATDCKRSRPPSAARRDAVAC